VAPWFCRSSQA